MHATATPPGLAPLLARIRDIELRTDATPGLPRECYTSAEFFEFERRAVFARSWTCVGRVEQLPAPGDCMKVEVAGEPLFVVRTEASRLEAMSAVCQHRGQVLPLPETPKVRSFRCPLHHWTYGLDGTLVGAPHMGGRDDVARLRETRSLRKVRLETWHGFVFVNLDANAAPLAPSLAKVEPLWENYPEHDMVAIPPTPAATALPWNWKIHVENFTDAYHPGFVHRGTHDIAPSLHPDGGVAFTPMAPGDNAIVRTVPLLSRDAGMTSTGWGEEAMFPAIAGLSDAQRSRLAFVLMPPSLTLVFAPGAIAYTMLSATGPTATFASSDRVTGGGWLLPAGTVTLPDFPRRAAMVREGASRIWAQDVPVNLAMQAGKESAFQPENAYGPLEVTLVQFNAWLVHAYRAALDAGVGAD